MIVLYETKLTNEQVLKYKKQGCRIASIFDKPYIKSGESVGIVITKLYKTTVEYIDTLLYNNDRVNVAEYQPDKDGVMQRIRKSSNKKISKLTIKYDDKTYHLTTLTEWKCTHQSEDDQIKSKTDYHPILQVYLNNIKDYKLKKEAEKLQLQYDLYEVNISDEELDSFLSTYAYAYDIDIYTDYNSRLDKLKAYHQIKYYMDNDLPVINESVSDVDIESFGDLDYLEDFVYKNTESSCI